METRNCQNCKNDFTIEPDDFSFYEKMKVPAPTFCPECRMIRRFNFRNEGNLFRHIDAHTGEEVFSTFASDAKVTIYDNNYWYSSEWDPLANGIEYDFSRSFFEQFRELFQKAPILARSVYNMVNSDYCNEASESKNAYLSFNCDYVENSAYVRKVVQIKDSFDLYESTENELCYEDVMVDQSYRTFFSVDCESCVDVWFSKGLRGCTNCFGCVNLTKKSNYFFNEPCTKEEYDKKIAQYNLASHEVITNLKNEIHEYWLKFPVKYNHTLRIVDSTGERVFDSKNVKDSHCVKGGENMKYCQNTYPKASNCYDYSVWGDSAENVYECMTCGRGIYNLKFCFNCWEEAQDLEYCVYCIGSKNCFGCVGLYKKEYCIFNKQYSKDEYFDMVSKIKEQMNTVPYMDQNGRIYKYGEFFPYDFSPNAYNESLAQDYFPINSEIAKEKGYEWREINIREYQTTLDAHDLPDDLNDTDENIINEILKCISCSRAYKIIPLELQFYKKIGLPLPRMCHKCRFTERFKFANPPKLYDRKCQKCDVDIRTSYAPERPEIVYCESCYQQEVN